jgi:hypothetical protein
VTNRRHHTCTNVQSKWQCKLFSKKNIVDAAEAIFMFGMAEAD